MVMAMSVASDKENKDGKVIAIGTRVTGKQTATATKRVMAIATIKAGKEEGDGKGGKSNGNGNKEGGVEEDGDGKCQQQPLIWRCRVGKCGGIVKM
jgi:hypothetical protein